MEFCDALEACKQGKGIQIQKDYSSDDECCSSMMKGHFQLKIIYLPQGSRSGPLEAHC